MKRIHGPVLMLVSTLFGTAGLLGLVGCAAKSDVGTAYQHTSGVCGIKTSEAYLNLQSACSSVSSHAGADSCNTQTSAFLQKYSDINCSLYDPKVGERTITADTIAQYKVAATNYSAKTDCTRPVERAFNKVLSTCLSFSGDSKVTASKDAGNAATPKNDSKNDNKNDNKNDQKVLSCGDAVDVFMVVAPADVQCTIAKSTLGRPAAVSMEAVQALRDGSGVDSEKGGACGLVIEDAYLKLELACTDVVTLAQAASCQGSADAFTIAHPNLSCHVAGEVPPVDAARIAILRAKGDHVSK